MSHSTFDNNMRKAIKISVFFIAILWVIQSAGVLFNLPLRTLGVIPGDWTRFYGVFTSAWVHGSYEHLTHNTLAILILLTGLHYGYPKVASKVFLLSWLGSGLGVWLFARDSVHLGASGITHGLFFFLFIAGVVRRDKRSVVLLMIAFFLYGGMVMTIFPREPHISFEAHFFGGVAGVIAAAFFARKDEKLAEKRYSWEDEDEDDPIIGDDWRTSSSEDYTVDGKD